jgi:hypothetical protein
VLPVWRALLFLPQALEPLVQEPERVPEQPEAFLLFWQRVLVQALVPERVPALERVQELPLA